MTDLKQAKPSHPLPLSVEDRLRLLDVLSEPKALQPKALTQNQEQELASWVSSHLGRPIGTDEVKSALAKIEPPTEAKLQKTTPELQAATAIPGMKKNGLWFCASGALLFFGTLTMKLLNVPGGNLLYFISCVPAGILMGKGLRRWIDSRPHADAPVSEVTALKVPAENSPWHVSEHQHPMDTHAVQCATLCSLETFNLDSPYQGKQRLKLTVAIHPMTRQVVVAFTLARGQFGHPSTIRVRFGTAEAREWAVTNHSAPAFFNSLPLSEGRRLFIEDAALFLACLAEQDDMLADISIYAAQSKLLSFSGRLPDKLIPDWLPSAQQQLPPGSLAWTLRHDGAAVDHIELASQTINKDLVRGEIHVRPDEMDFFWPTWMLTHGKQTAILTVDGTAAQPIEIVVYGAEHRQDQLTFLTRSRQKGQYIRISNPQPIWDAIRHGTSFSVHMGLSTTGSTPFRFTPPAWTEDLANLLWT